jgi:hypothetical protein
MAPHIRRPYLKTLRGEPSGKPFITEGMFSHSVYHMQNRPRLPEGCPVPQEKPDISLNRYPAGGIGLDINYIHRGIVAFMLILDYRVENKRIKTPVYDIV